MSSVPTTSASGQNTGLIILISCVATIGGLLFGMLAALRSRPSPTQWALGLGALWGWLPCGLVYSALASSLSAGSAARGALMMLAFGLGTLPNLLLAGIVLARLNEFVRRPAVRIFSGLLVLGFGLYGLLGLVRLMGWI